jgi:peptide/nickel transport system substrate-binding protein
MYQDVGMNVRTVQVDQSTLIQRAIDGEYQAQTWRQYPYTDPDSLYVWWYGQGNPVNFMRFDDPVVNDLLDQGREEPDPQERIRIYQELNRRINEQRYLLWGTWTIWAIPSASDVHGIVGARPVGTDGGEDYTGLALGHDPALIWREQ